MSTATAKTEVTENWDDDFEDSRQSPKKIIERHREESWDMKTTMTTTRQRIWLVRRGRPYGNC
jgi:hypothetical protein